MVDGGFLEIWLVLAHMFAVCLLRRQTLVAASEGTARTQHGRLHSPPDPLTELSPGHGFYGAIMLLVSTMLRPRAPSLIGPRGPPKNPRGSMWCRKIVGGRPPFPVDYRCMSGYETRINSFQVLSLGLGRPSPVS